MQVRGLLLAGLALLLVPLPTSQAQAPGTLLIEDAANDVQVAVGDNAAGSPAGRYAAVDLRSISMEEAEALLTFHLVTTDLDATEPPFIESSFYTINFAYGINQYRVLLYRFSTGQEYHYAGTFEAYDPAQQDFNRLGSVAVSTDMAASMISAVVPRALVLDEYGAEPFPGRVLTGFHVTAAGFGRDWDGNIDFPPGSQTTVPTTQVEDRMPYSGNGTIDFPITIGLAQTGHARLESEIPVRSSNGEATTFVYQVTAYNLGDMADRFLVSTSLVPVAWEVQVPDEPIELKAGESTLFPVLVTTPFAHKHGEFASMIVEMKSMRDPTAVGRVEIGIRYNAIPQPAGHHDQVWLHSRQASYDQVRQAWEAARGNDGTSAFMNAAEVDDLDQKIPVSPRLSRGDDAGQMRFTWIVYLSPALDMGLDFDLARTGTIEVAFNTALPVPAASLSGRLVHFDPSMDDGRGGGGGLGGGSQNDEFWFGNGLPTVLATLTPTLAQDMGANGQDIAFETQIVATPESDFKPYVKDASLALQIDITGTGARPFFGPTDEPKLAGGSMQLPLEEYHDPVDQVFNSMPTLMLDVVGKQQREVNPGRTVVYQLNLMNHGDAADAYHFELSGPNAPWARLLAGNHVELAAGASVLVPVAVTAPATALDGDAADVVVKATSMADSQLKTLARLLTTVDTDAEHADEAQLAAELEGGNAKQAPGPAVFLLLVGLAALAVARRRRHQ